MKAAVWVDYGQVEIRDVDVPDIGPKEVLVKVEAASLCTSDSRMIEQGENDPKHPPPA